MSKSNAKDTQGIKKQEGTKDILPQGTPKQRSPYGEVKDPPVPNRAHTEMKCDGARSK